MRQRIIDVLKSVSGQPTVPADDDSLFESGYLDSFALTDMVNALEAEFKVKVPDSDLTPRKFDSISRIESYLATKV